MHRAPVVIRRAVHHESEGKERNNGTGNEKRLRLSFFGQRFKQGLESDTRQRRKAKGKNNGGPARDSEDLHSGDKVVIDFKKRRIPPKHHRARKDRQYREADDAHFVFRVKKSQKNESQAA